MVSSVCLFFTTPLSHLLALKMCDLYFAYDNTKTSVTVYVCVHVSLLSSPLLLPPFFMSLCGITSHTAFPLCAVRECVWVMVECWCWVWALTDAYDRQMVLVVVSLITATRLGVKAGVCLVMETNRRQIYPRLPLTHFFCLLCQFYIFLFLPPHRMRARAR